MQPGNFIDDLFFALFGWPSTVPAKEETEFAPFKLEYLKKLNLNREQKKKIK